MLYTSLIMLVGSMSFGAQDRHEMSIESDEIDIPSSRKMKHTNAIPPHLLSFQKAMLRRET